MNGKYRNTLIGIAWLFVLLSNCQLFGQDIAARISSREAWVGSPIVLQIQISNAKKYSPPEPFEIDGCDIRSAGTPSQSSRITIINGRRSESRSVTMQYLITPRRQGKFKVPELEINVDGKVKTTRSIEFVATKSETGDLLFVEIEGDKDSVYVGEPLKLKLKLWIKPFSDRDRQIKLDEGHMWQMISNQTSWGAFTDRLQELTEDRQRPGGKTVLRKDADGVQREYYLYEIDATVYPNKPGKIDASDLQIVVNYPQSLGRRRDPFDDVFGGRSMLQDMMNDEFFSSPFSRRLTVSQSRPVVAEVSVDATEVLAVPTADQPADYRGAVGRYQVIAEAEPTTVSAGDPITLRIGVVGDGPMELVQAPPLHEIESLTNDFQVTDQSLAGFVQDETKVFVTSIRPRHENVKQIPPIPFSFFDPTKEAYETVYTKPISVDVEKAESLDINSIVSEVADNSPTHPRNSPSDAGTSSSSRFALNLQNNFSSSLVESSEPKTSGWLYFAIVPPACWLMVAIGRIALALPAGIGLFLPSKTTAAKRIKAAKETSEVADALRHFVAKRAKSDCPTFQHAVGKLRDRNVYDVAAELESVFEKIGTNTIGLGETPTKEALLNEFRRESLLLLESIDGAFDAARPKLPQKNDSKKPKSRRRSVTTSLIGLAFLIAVSPGLSAEELSTETLRTVLEEANSTYRAAERLVDSEPAKATQMFATSAERYQLLVNQGVRNDQLFVNLANAWYRSDETVKAVVNYHRALWLNQNNSTARQNLLAIEKMGSVDAEPGVSNMGDFSLDFGDASKLLSRVISFTGHMPVVIVFAIASTLFWLLLLIKTLRPRLKILRWSIIPLVLAVASGAAIYQLERSNPAHAILLNDTVELKLGDGEEFPTQATIRAASGQAVSIIDQRATWRKVRLPDGKTGWLPQSAIEQVAL